MDISKLSTLFANGQFVAAFIGAVDAVAALLVVSGVIHTAPDAGLVASVLTVAFNAAAMVLSYIQHTQHVVKLRLVHEAAEATAYRAWNKPIALAPLSAE